MTHQPELTLRLGRNDSASIHSAVLLVAVLVVACTSSNRRVEGALPTVIASPQSQPAVPDAALIVEMLPEGDMELVRFSDDMLPDSMVVRSLFRTNAGVGYVATYDTQSGEHCFGVAIPDATRGQCGVEGDRFSTALGGLGVGDVLVEYVGILGPADVVVYEIEVEDGFLVAIQAWDGAGYANWIGHGMPVMITAHFADGRTEDVAF